MATTLGFIGLGVMGEAMCRNLAKKSGETVVAHDTRRAPLEALGRDGVTAAPSTGDLVARAEVIFLCLPGEPQVRAVCLGAGGLASLVRAGQTVVDMSTCPVALARELAVAFAARSARTRRWRGRPRLRGTARSASWWAARPLSSRGSGPIWPAWAPRSPTAG